MVIGRLAIDGWAVTFGTAWRELGKLQPLVIEWVVLNGTSAQKGYLVPF